jgi:hypothetical protein
MASSTDTISSESGTTTREATRPPEPRQPSRLRRAALAWGAIVAACIAVAALAVVTLRGGDDNVDIPPARLDSQAELQAHLEG